jgi:hypothetical protein
MLLPIGLIIGIWIFFMWGMKRPRTSVAVDPHNPPEPLVKIDVTPRLIGLVTGVISAFGPIFWVGREWFQGNGFNGYLLAGGILIGLISGGAVWGGLSLGSWLINRSKSKNPSQHF